MYSSLSKVDLVAEKDGVQRYIQTDHRTPAEMDETAELSVLFALARTLAPRHMCEPGQPPPTILYAALNGASTAVAEAVAAAGAELESMESGQPQIVSGPSDPRSAADIADAAFRSLAHAVALREGIPLSATGLANFETQIRDAGWDFDNGEHEIEAWSAVLELAALTGECIRQTHGGRWLLTVDALAEFSPGSTISAADFGPLPFCFQRGSGGLANAANKPIRSLTEPGQSVLQMLVVESPAVEGAGLTMPVLKPHDWGTDGMICRPLFDAIDDGPIVVIAKDMPNSVGYSTDTNKTPEEVAALFAEALANLSVVNVELERLDLEVEMDLFLVHGDFYAAEKILDEAFMHALHAKLGHDLLAVSIPVKGRMFVTAGAQHPDNLSRLIALTRTVFERDEGPISPRVFGVIDGKVAALVQPSGPPLPAPKQRRGLWGRLFGKANEE